MSKFEGMLSSAISKYYIPFIFAIWRHFEDRNFDLKNVQLYHIVENFLTRICINLICDRQWIQIYDMIVWYIEYHVYQWRLKSTNGVTQNLVMSSSAESKSYHRIAYYLGYMRNRIFLSFQSTKTALLLDHVILSLT